MRLFCLLCFFCLLGTTELLAQQYLQMERRGSFKVKRYAPGEELTFRLVGDPTWYTEEILELFVEENRILFANRVVMLSDISHIRRFKARRWSKPLGQQLYNFGLGWLLFSLGAAVVGDPLTMLTVWVPLTSGAVGFLIQKIFRRKTFKIGKKRRLRLLDLTFRPLDGASAGLNFGP